MRRLMRAFTVHPASVGESYFAHMRAAFSFGATMIAAGLACLLHGVLPFAFVKTGSRAVQVLHTRMVTQRDRRSRSPVSSAIAEQR